MIKPRIMSHSRNRRALRTLGSVLTAVIFSSLCLSLSADQPLSLAGAWRFQLDREDAGLTNRFFARPLTQQINLPGALQNQGFGDDISLETKWTGDVGSDRWLRGASYAKYRQPGNLKVPFFLQPEKHYVGAAWYQRDVEVPAGWQGRRVVLTLERTHWQTSAWLDGQPLGTNNSLGTPHVYDLGTKVAPGRHTLTVRVDNRVLVGVGEWSHSVSDHTQGNWNGLIGALELASTSPVWIEDVQAFPNVAKKCVRLKVRVGNATGQAGQGTLTAGTVRQKFQVSGFKSEQIEVEVPLGDQAPLWDEFHPALCRLKVRLQGDAADDEREVAFGLREITAQGRQFSLNGRPVFFRGTLECCIFPRTGYPPTDVESWRKVIRACKAYGLNHIRFHSWCPPEAAFTAADELGFYYQVECGVWTNPGSDKRLDDWIYAESERIVRAYGNHPSFLLLTHGNEPHGPNHVAFLTGWVNFWKQRDPRRLVTSGSAYPQLAENQYHVYHGPRGPGGWLGKDYRKTIETLEAPVIVHEMGQWCVYPNFDEIAKYTGPLKPKNFEIFRDSLTEHGMFEQGRDFLRASGRLQVLCYKEEIEAALRTPGVGGFQLLDLHDFPGQGTALVGVLDPFWESKGYVTAEEYSRFCGPTVPLARLLKRAWTTDETLTAEVEVAHFGPAPLADLQALWKLVAADGRTLASGDFPTRTLPLGCGMRLGQVSVDLSKLASPLACKLVVGFKGTAVENDWNAWIYPGKPPVETPSDTLVASALDDVALARLAQGGKVLLLPGRLSSEHPRLGFEPVFWNRYMFNTQGRQTLGLLCDASHPALAGFPTEVFQDWQWQDIVNHAQGLVLDDLPRALRPVVQVIDDWNTNRKLGLLFECRVGLGRLLVCSADLAKDLEKRPAARQLRQSVLAYMQGDKFSPKTEVTREDLLKMLERTKPSQLVKLGARILEADSEDHENGNVAANAIDGDPDTLWHTRWQPTNAPMPHHLIIDLGREIALQGLTYLPRQDMVNGRIGSYEIYGSNDPKSWGLPIAKGQWQNTDQLQTVRFPQLLKARYLKLVARSSINNEPFAAAGEVDVLLPVK